MDSIEQPHLAAILPRPTPPSTPLHVQRLKRTPTVPKIQAAMECSRTLSPWPPIVLLLSPGVLDAWCFDLDSFPCERHLCSVPSLGSELPLLGPSLVQPAGRVPPGGRERGPPSTPLPQRQHLQHPPCFLHRLSSSLASWLASLLLAHSLAVRSSTSTARHLFDAMPSRVVVRSTMPCSSSALPSAPALSCLRTIRQNARMSIVSWTMPWWCPTSSLHDLVLRSPTLQAATVVALLELDLSKDKQPHPRRQNSSVRPRCSVFLDFIK